MSNITIIIKTFQRLKSLECLLKSIEDQKLNNIPIIILDDSRENYKDAILEKFSKLNINYIVTEFDIGLSKGRNILLEHVKTDYIIFYVMMILNLIVVLI
ncbi:glycosyltransferase family 2 protein [Phascolarctobacterium faecium]|uniref:glycosyltransferase family 2 protein n=1 Tax=Phascolarctobacterium faecium TaxID=33025 RepID=UPI003AB51966